MQRREYALGNLSYLQEDEVGQASRETGGCGAGASQADLRQAAGGHLPDRGDVQRQRESDETGFE